MTKHPLVALSALVLLAGCSGLNYAVQNYGDVDSKAHYYNGQKFSIFDKPDVGRLMVTPSAGQAFLQGLTFGLAATPEMTMQNAAQSYLDQTGRKCTVGDPKLIVDPQYEVFYVCS